MIKFGFTHTRERSEQTQRHGLLQSNLFKRLVWEHAIGRTVFLESLLSAPSAKHIKEREALPGKVHGCGPRGLEPLFSRPSQSDRAALLEKFGDPGPQAKRIEPVRIHGKPVADHHLAHKAPPLCFGEFSPDAEGGQLVMASGKDLVRGIAKQDVDDLPLPETRPGMLLHAIDRACKLLGGHGDIIHNRRLQAVVAILASSLRRLAEILKENLPPAACRLAERQHGFEFGDAAALILDRAVRVINETALIDDIPQAIEHPGVRGLAVAPRPARLLVVVLDALGHVHVHHKPHVRLVDAHAKGNGGHHDDPVLGKELLLAGCALLALESGMIGKGAHALLFEILGDLLGAIARIAVHDAALAAVLGANEREQLIPLAALFGDPIPDVWPVKTRHKAAGILKEPLADLFSRVDVRRRREGNARHLGPALPEDRELRVFGPEVMPPHGHAVRLVNCKKRDLKLREHLEHALHQKPLGRHIEDVHLAVPKAPPHIGRIPRGERGVEKCRAHAELLERAHLIGHQSDERRDDNGNSRPHQRRNLVAKALSTAGRHEHERITALSHMLHNVQLETAKGMETENALKNAERLLCRCQGNFRENHLRGKLGAILTESPRSTKKGGPRIRSAPPLLLC